MASLSVQSMTNRVLSYGSLSFGRLQTESRFVDRTIHNEHASACMSAGCGVPNIGGQQSVAGSLSCACMRQVRLGSLRIRGAGAAVDHAGGGGETEQEVARLRAMCADFLHSGVYSSGDRVVMLLEEKIAQLQPAGEVGVVG